MYTISKIDWFNGNYNKVIMDAFKLKLVLYILTLYLLTLVMILDN